MKRPSFALYLIAAFVAAALVARLPVHLGGVHGYQTPALWAALAWFALFALALRFYGRRALWLLIAALPALFWLAVVGGTLVCPRGCG